MKSNMKFKTLSLILLVSTLLSSFQLEAKDKGEPKMHVHETTHDFGVIKEDGGPVTCEFKFSNSGNSNLVIYSATAQCGCTKPEFPEKPIAPGKEGVIKVTYNPIGRPGAFSKMVTVKTNGNPSKIRLKIKGTVMPK